LLITVVTTPVAVFVALIVTPGNKAFEGSVTMPPSWAFCANAEQVRNRQRRIVRTE
jgi:hypothetical protein